MIATEKVSPLEIERKFLVKRLPADLATFPRDEIAQGYLATESGGVQVRLRKKGNVRSLTYKRTVKNGREEREIRLSAEQFEALWPATAGRRLAKVRYEMPWKEHTIEIDVYRGRHDGLIVAEVEFADEKSCAAFKPPDWMDEDVTGKSRYSNVLLAHE
jgi:adenylate cyclase